jgi:signal transduction histidine kinase
VALEKALREQAVLQGRFIAILGHDLRNPLNAVLMAARRLKQVDLSERHSKSVDYVISGAKRMARLIDQLLDLARARQTGGIPVRPVPGTDLAEIVRSAVDELRAAHPRVDIAAYCEERMCGAWDPDRLAQVVSNLVGNAIVHGRGWVEVRLTRTDGDAILQVRNGGLPIPAETMPRIFEAFQRLGDGDALGRAGGLGLGLFIVERIVAAHRGRIAVHSTEEEGTTFTVTLPASAARALSAPAPDPEPVSPRVAIG